MIAAADGQGRIRLITNSAANFRPAVPVYYTAKYLLFWFNHPGMEYLTFLDLKKHISVPQNPA
jgi:hypothetical protein